MFDAGGGHVGTLVGERFESCLRRREDLTGLVTNLLRALPATRDATGPTDLQPSTIYLQPLLLL